jgi:molybdenum cofactor cytidylyltransferase
MSNNSCAAILLAAGASTRLGRPKQLIQFHGESLLRRTARLAMETGCAPILVVLGYEAARMQQELNGFDTKVVINPDWRSGMGSSLRCGVEALQKQTPVPERVLLLLSDQPRLSIDILQSLITRSANEHSPIIASRYADRLGVPAVFHKSMYAALQCVKGDKGARQIIQQHQDQVVSIDFPEGIIDIDTSDDLAMLNTTSPE